MEFLPPFLISIFAVLSATAIHNAAKGHKARLIIMVLLAGFATAIAHTHATLVASELEIC